MKYNDARIDGSGRMGGFPETLPRIPYIMVCPQCGGRLLQSGRVDVFFPVDEDSTDAGVHVGVTRGFLVVNENMKAHPGHVSSNGIKINFFCRVCEGEFDLAFSSGPDETYVFTQITKDGVEG